MHFHAVVVDCPLRFYYLVTSFRMINYFQLGPLKLTYTYNDQQVLLP